MEKPIFRADEALAMAVQIEEQGLAFYKACREAKIVDSRIEKVLDYLIDQEIRHKKAFSRMKSDLESRPLPESYPGEMRSYLDSFVKDRVFDEIGAGAAAVSNMDRFNQAVEFGIRFEKASIRFYSALKEVVRRSEHETIDSVIGEEREHIRRLRQLEQELDT